MGNRIRGRGREPFATISFVLEPPSGREEEFRRWRLLTIRSLRLERCRFCRLGALVMLAVSLTALGAQQRSSEGLLQIEHRQRVTPIGLSDGKSLITTHSLTTMRGS